ncbi:Globin-like domain and Globin, structural domain-containing protein [Strongyloides ratti]|uniref:Globin-like domain and Globin, structural domain-containing protein n=1 Tax=Strongyloides ratti TaxID=34506 RepID=A0A090LLA3_STRRB|nr:Globin-like domain and Globin, structural domain-containing protein [Strongyloides ratti]CEF68953.1 Globin-like domain and Globin, structural domain-containing protein [Strongyloides ratti]
MGNSNSSKFHRISKKCVPSSSMSSSVIGSKNEKKYVDQSLNNKTKSMYELSTKLNETKNKQESKDNSIDDIKVDKKNEILKDNIKGDSKYLSSNEKKKNDKISKRQICRSQTVRIKLDNDILDIDSKNNSVRPIIKPPSKVMPLIHSTSAINFLSNLRSDNSSITNNTNSQLSKKSSLRSKKISLPNKDKVNNSISLIKKNSKKDLHPVSNLGKEIIISCFENPHGDLGQRVIGRLYEKRIDYQKFIITFGRQNMRVLADQLKLLMENVVENLDNITTIENLSKAYGEAHVDLKVFGFKPDFWVGLADSLTVECVILDQATHSPTDVVAAWSQLITTIFSNIRDGYYGALRLHRIASRKNMIAKKTLSSEISSSNSQQTDSDATNSSTLPISSVNDKDINLLEEIKNYNNNNDANRTFIDYSQKKVIDLPKNNNPSKDNSIVKKITSFSLSSKPSLTRWKTIQD